MAGILFSFNINLNINLNDIDNIFKLVKELDDQYTAALPQWWFNLKTKLHQYAQVHLPDALIPKT